MSSLALVQKSYGRRLSPSLPILAVAILTAASAVAAATADRTEAKPSEKKKADAGVSAYAIATRDLGKRERDVVGAGPSTRFNATKNPELSLDGSHLRTKSRHQICILRGDPWHVTLKP